MENEFEAANVKETKYLLNHPDALSELKNAPPKNEDTSDQQESEMLNDAPYVPSGFLLWVDVNMSVKLKTTEHPESEWVTLWCDDEPSPVPNNNIYYFWTWYKSNWNKNQARLKSLGVPIESTEYCAFAPCAIAIPYDYVIEDPYHT